LEFVPLQHYGGGLIAMCVCLRQLGVWGGGAEVFSLESAQSLKMSPEL